MKEKLLEDFIKYAKEQYGYEISVERAAMADSFEGIFGADFLKVDEYYTVEGDSMTVQYINSIRPTIVFSGTTDYLICEEEMEFAA